MTQKLITSIFVFLFSCSFAQAKKGYKFAGDWELNTNSKTFEREITNENGDIIGTESIAQSELYSVTIFNKKSCKASAELIENNVAVAGGSIGCHLKKGYIKVFDSHSGDVFFQGQLSIDKGRSKRKILIATYINKSTNLPLKDRVVITILRQAI